jgi:hypothetical protein
MNRTTFVSLIQFNFLDGSIEMCVCLTMLTQTFTQFYCSSMMRPCYGVLVGLLLLGRFDCSLIFGFYFLGCFLGTFVLGLF